jgi:hypothetical protein
MKTIAVRLKTVGILLHLLLIFFIVEAVPNGITLLYFDMNQYVPLDLAG